MRNAPIGDKTIKELKADHKEIWRTCAKHNSTKMQALNYLGISDINQPENSCFLCEIAIRRAASKGVIAILTTDMCPYCPIKDWEDDTGNYPFHYCCSKKTLVRVWADAVDRQEFDIAQKIALKIARRRLS